MPLEEPVLVKKDLQSNSKVFHPIVDSSHASFPTIEKEKRITILRTMNHQINLLFMM